MNHEEKDNDNKNNINMEHNEMTTIGNELLLRYGVVSDIPIITETLNANTWKKWASYCTIVTPEIMSLEGDGEYAFYRNILHEPEFPFHDIVNVHTPIGQAILKYFHIQNFNDIQLDDAFCVHYNMNQIDTSGAKHMDPSDITINLCVDKSDDCQGSQVRFYGTKELYDPNNIGEVMKYHDTEDDTSPNTFLVNQHMGYATIHWGDHPHETTSLLSGYRTNIILTYCYTDTTRSTVRLRSCYNV